MLVVGRRLIERVEPRDLALLAVALLVSAVPLGHGSHTDDAGAVQLVIFAASFFSRVSA